MKYKELCSILVNLSNSFNISNDIEANRNIARDIISTLINYSIDKLNRDLGDIDKTYYLFLEDRIDNEYIIFLITNKVIINGEFNSNISNEVLNDFIQYTKLYF